MQASGQADEREELATLAEEVALLKESAAEQEREFGDLLACLGQESAKVAALQELLMRAGVDAGPVLVQVETDYGFGDEDEDAGGYEEDAQKEEGQSFLQSEGINASAAQHPEATLPAEDAVAAAHQEKGAVPAEAAARGDVTLPEASLAEQVESSLEGLPEGELLSPPWKQPRLPQEDSSKIAAEILPSAGMQALGAEPTQGGAAAGEINFDGWDADGEGDWNIS